MPATIPAHNRSVVATVRESIDLPSRRSPAANTAASCRLTKHRRAVFWMLSYALDSPDEGDVEYLGRPSAAGNTACDKEMGVHENAQYAG
jgi:hypothetical protein